MFLLYYARIRHFQDWYRADLDSLFYYYLQTLIVG